MKYKVHFLILILFLTLFSGCVITKALFMNDKKPFTENFSDSASFKNNWENDSWKSPASYSLENNQLKITTRPTIIDRVKVRTKRNNFKTGIYTWKIFIPNFKLYEQCSIGAFLYHNEQKEFEFDFEIGSGQKADRDKINLKDTEAIVYCVSQFSPSNSNHFNVPMNEWATFKMELIDVNGFYFVKWFINNKQVKELQTKVRSTINFRVHNSLENLFFMGDKVTSTENYVLFDSFSFENNSE
jgi:hypothetical protein